MSALDPITEAVERAAERVIASKLAEFIERHEERPVGLRMLRAAQVREKLGQMSESSFDRLKRDPTEGFPKPVDYVGGQWREDEIDDWIRKHPRKRY